MRLFSVGDMNTWEVITKDEFGIGQERTLWGKYHRGLVKISEMRFGCKMPESDLLIAIVIEAAKDKDEEYLYSQAFYDLCCMVKLDAFEVLKGIKRIWNANNAN